MRLTLFLMIGMLAVPSLADMHEAAHHLVRQQTPAGLFHYEFDLVKGKYTRQNNIVRQAGAAYGLAEYLAYKRDATVEQALVRAIKALEAKTLVYKGGGVVSLNTTLKKASTGATALSLLAALHYQQTTKNQQFAPLIQRWLKGLVSLYTDKKGFQRSPKSQDESPYFNGEGWLALGVYAQMFPNDIVVQAILEQLETYLMTKYTKKFDISFFHWGLMATIKRYEPTQDQKFLTFATHQIQSFFKVQPKYRPHVNACYSIEGLIPSYYYLKKRGQEALAKKIKERLDIELAKTKKFQVPKNAKSIKINKTTEIHSETLPSLSGGFINGDSRPQLRIDFTQHCLSALIKADVYLKDKEA